MPEQENEDVTTEETEETEGSGNGGQDGDGLADKGRAALAAERKARRDAEKARRAAEKELADLKAAQQAKKDGDDAQSAADQARRDAEAAATRKANERILRAELRAAAKGVLVDESDAAVFIDLSQFEPDDNGDFDASEISEAISDLVRRKPHLAAKAGGFEGGDSGGGPRSGGRVPQLTKADLKRMTSAQIVQARKEGRLNRLQGLE